MVDAGGRRQRRGNDGQHENMQGELGEQHLYEPRHDFVWAGDFGKDEPGKRCREVGPAHEHRQDEHGERRGFLELARIGDGEVALHHLRLGPHRDGGHDDQREDEQPPFPAGQGDEPVVGEIAGGKGRQRLHTFPRAADLGEDGPHEHEHTHEHDDALHGFGVEDPAQSADEDGEPHDDRHQPDERPDGHGEDLGQQERRPLDDRRAVYAEEQGKNKGHRPRQAGRAVPEAEQLRRGARAEAFLPLARWPRQEAVDGPRPEPDVARGHEQHLQAVGMGEPAEPDERHRRDVGGDIGEGLHAEPYGAAEHGVLAASLMHQKGEDREVAGPEQDLSHGCAPSGVSPVSHCGGARTGTSKRPRTWKRGRLQRLHP